MNNHINGNELSSDEQQNQLKEEHTQELNIKDEKLPPLLQPDLPKMTAFTALNSIQLPNGI